MRLLLPLTFLLAACSSQAQQPSILDSGGPLNPEQAAYDVTFYALDLTIDPQARTLRGTAAVHATFVHPHDALVLDLDTLLAVESVVDAAGVPLAFHRDAGRLRISLGGTQQPGTPAVVHIAYGGAPRVARNAPWDGGFVWATTEAGQPWIATAVQGEGADLWWPCKDHPSDEPDSMAISITVPAGLVVATNGKLRGRQSVPGGTRYDWFVSTPINNYGVALNIAPYRELAGTFTSTTGEEVPLFLWVTPDRADRAPWLFEEMKRHLDFYERTLGPYPFRADKYGVAHTPHLGMEHQSIIAYGSDFDADPDGFDWLHHHELGHEWWGNLVTAWDWRDFWIHEGFCTYMQGLYAEELEGEAGLAQQLGKWQNIQNERPIAPREWRSTDGAYNLDIYYKGARVLHALRFLVGDEAFRRSLRRFAYPSPEWERRTDGTQTRFVTTDDYVALVNQLSEQDVSWFFEVYVRQAALPRLRVRREAQALHLQWDVPEDLPFPMPVEVEVDGTRKRVEMPDGSATVQVPAGAEVEVDPRRWLLRAE